MSQGSTAGGDGCRADAKLLRWLLSPCPHSSILSFRSLSCLWQRPLCQAAPPSPPARSTPPLAGKDDPRWHLGECLTTLSS